MLICLQLLLGLFGHFGLVLASHNWFYAKPFSRLVGDLFQIVHFLLGILGCYVVYLGNTQIVDGFNDLTFQKIKSFSSFYAIFCVFIGAIVIPINELLRNRWRLSPKLYSENSQSFNFSNEFYTKKTLGQLDDSYKLELIDKVITCSFMPKNFRLKILHLSDLHFGGNDNYFYFEKVFAKVDHEVYDYVFFTGDLIDNVSCLRWVVPLLKKIRSKYGKFAVLGNHDLWNSPDLVRKYLRKAGFTYLTSQGVKFFHQEISIGLFGNEYPWFSNHLSEVANEKYDIKILLTHSPDEFFWGTNLNFNLIFCGHVHGGQIALPLFGPLIIPSKFGRRFGSGLFQSGKTIMNVSRGISGSLPLRINCKPEVTVLNLLPERN